MHRVATTDLFKGCAHKLLSHQSFIKSQNGYTESWELYVKVKVYKNADSELCFDLSGLISAVGVTDIYSKHYRPEEFFACGL